MVLRWMNLFYSIKKKDTNETFKIILTFTRKCSIDNPTKEFIYKASIDSDKDINIIL